MTMYSVYDGPDLKCFSAKSHQHAANQAAVKLCGPGHDALRHTGESQGNGLFRVRKLSVPNELTEKLLNVVL